MSGLDVAGMRTWTNPSVRPDDKEPDMSTPRHAQADRDGAADTVHPPMDVKIAVVVPSCT
jgi:hypothetical protein